MKLVTTFDVSPDGFNPSYWNAKDILENLNREGEAFLDLEDFLLHIAEMLDNGDLEPDELEDLLTQDSMNYVAEWSVQDG